MAAWLDAASLDRGATIPVQTAYDLSTVWYAGRMEQDWVPPTPAEAESVFRRFGLTGDFWALT